MKQSKDLEELKRLLYIKRICFGFGIPPRDSQCFKDIETLRNKLFLKYGAKRIEDVI